ncbi:DNA-processing protein DprA [Candidatus Parcubacteria bacterium]|nr:DNA-processing protein DprA [Candidatus Parcubacteria bacterium]
MENDLRQLGQDEYPSQLREIPKPPQTLFARGHWPKVGTTYLAVVGSRALTSYGREACEKLITGLSGYPISIVSGLALGADACAHKAALAAGLHTIAVPGSGLNDDVIYPRANAGLAGDILKAGGLLLSEHEGGYKAAPYDFPSRNRIMVGLSHAVLLVEAGNKSGTLITARLTHEYNRDLLCIPHRIGDPHGFGAHLFLRLGATLVSDSLHILEALHIDPCAEGARAEFSLEGYEKTIYDLLTEPLPRDELIRASNLNPSDALTALVTLELKGILKEEFGAWRRV